MIERRSEEMRATFVKSGKANKRGEEPCAVSED
jgi:hypothetical protein